MVALPPRLTLVSYLYWDAMSPRGARAQELASRLRSDWEIELICGPKSSDTSASFAKFSALSHLSRRMLIDRQDFWSKRHFRFWEPDTDCALLIGFPFSPIAEAARRLSKKGIPYVVDVGDPWVLTESEPLRKGIGLWRSLRSEKSMLDHAAGLIVTTNGQAAAFRAHVPRLPILVRPNGYAPVDWGDFARGAHETPNGPNPKLRLAHFGKLYEPRVDIRPFLDRLASADRWSGVSLHQFGDMADPRLAGVSSDVEIEMHGPRPWDDAIAAARDFDLAIAVCNRNQHQLPSKVIQYLTLPIPRVAIVEVMEGASSEYLSDKPGWLMVSPHDREVDEKIMAHLERPWPAGSLWPPSEESWPEVAREVSEFLARCFGRTKARRPPASRPEIVDMAAR